MLVSLQSTTRSGVTGFSLERPCELAEAVGLKARYEDSVVLAGGSHS